MPNEKILNLPLLMHKQKMQIKWNSKISGIYAWINEINGKIYVGQTINFYKRIYDEMNGFRNNRDQNMFKLFNAVKKYGMNNFRVVRLMECPEKYLNKIEILLIEYYNAVKNGYNCTNGGNGTRGHIVTIEQIEKQRVSVKKFWSEEKKKEHSEKMKVWFNAKSKDEQNKIRSGNGWWLDKECKKNQMEKCRESMTAERIQKQRKSMLKYYEENGSKKAIKMDIISPTNEVVRINGLCNFCRDYNVGLVGILDIIDNKKKHHKGWHIDPSFIYNPPKLKELVSPDGELYKFQSTLQFCRKYNLDFAGIKRVLNRQYKHYKLWRLPETSLEDAINNKNKTYKNVKFQFPDDHIENILDRKKFCKIYGYSSKYLYNFLKNKSIGDMFHDLKLISK